ncbi:unnamed protein product [Chilo suppressalis]|uniref:ZZ-type domain-containing protein n=1 Tax=Chilo suppressalis TaxID=168631 RepID=A0ABN8L5B1_CHISP|nr:unnamed protein product [Chilo suppressalis]
MVNYCCVQNCGRNSKLSSHLNYYSLPKERHRRTQWLKAGGRVDLLEKCNIKSAHRFCSRHFAPSSIKNRNLCPDAVPTLYLPGSNNADDTDDAPVEHQDIICNNCSNTIIGFRYKCVTCVDYDLCPKCEMSETHAQHYMLRIPRPTKFKIVDDLTKKWKDFFKAEHIRPDCRETTDYSSCDSSDDEPITKYSKQYDSGVDLSEDVKETLRKEVARVLKIKDFSKTKKAREKTLLKRSAGGTATHPIKKQKADPLPVTDKIASTDSSAGPAVPEVAFADVNQLGDQVDVKYEVPMSSGNIEDFVQPMMHVKLSDDLTELMIEMTQNGQRTVYKYSD